MLACHLRFRAAEPLVLTAPLFLLQTQMALARMLVIRSALTPVVSSASQATAPFPIAATVLCAMVPGRASGPARLSGFQLSDANLRKSTSCNFLKSWSSDWRRDRSVQSGSSRSGNQLRQGA